MPKIAPIASLTEQTYEGLRTLLLNGRVEPGAKLKASELSELLNTNMSAVREALAKLSSEGLVVSEPHRGFRVAPVSGSELRHLTEVRIPIEVMAIRGAIEGGDLEWEQGIIAALHGLLRTAREGESGAMAQEWSKAHHEFHQALVAACDNPWVLRLRESLAAHSDRYRWLSVAVSGKKRDVDQEHRRLAEAFLARDAHLAVELMVDHIEQTTAVLLRAGLAHTAPGTPSRRYQILPRGKPSND